MNVMQQRVMASQTRPFGLKAIQIYLVSILFYTTSHTLLILLPLNSHALGASPAQIGLIMGAYMFTSMFLRPIAGNIVDKFGTKRIFVAALIMNVAVLSMYLIAQLWVFAVLRVVQGVILSFVSMVLHLMIIEALPEKARGQGLSLFSLSSMLPYTYGPFLTLFFADRVPMAYIFTALIPIGLMTLFIGLNIRMPQHEKQGAQQAAAAQRSAPYRGWRDRELLLPSVTMLLASAVIGTVAAFLPLYLANRDLPYAGLYFLTETLVLITLRFFGRKFIRTDGRFPAYMAAVLVSLITIASALIRHADSPAGFVFAAVCSGIALSMLYPALLTYVSFVVPEQSRGKGIGWFIAAADLGTSAGTWGLSLVANAYSYETMFSGCIAIGASALLMILLFSRNREVRG
ncbi:MFS transporter [Paenibacillus sp. sptzw28]|uniref:staphylopine family metallophore export MFS transporter CntE n=1 Tax=Paenibacillus sp. sptzw28 TaxID=715179 RepID=UPI001C6E3944|nr:MFS transporter [Paenibacillus sp. sptzw28]QYR22000.1 MFS transporter [Paenibacillus sp. sptzw28]